MEKEQSILIKGASFGYKKTQGNLNILRGLNLNFYPGDFIGVVGLNGIGKSTFLKSLCGLLPILEGKVLIDGTTILELPLEELAKKIAIVLTEKIGGFNLTAYDVVAAGQMPYTNSFNKLEAQHRAVIDAAINSCGIKDHQFKPVNELSDGLFQKTVIAKAMAQQTPILLLDEPTAFLDYASKHELFITLQTLAKKENKCVLVSSHDLDLILKYCTKILVIGLQGAELLSTNEAKENKVFRDIGGGFI
jgi:iron complex transport system ATP-binding protein